VQWLPLKRKRLLRIYLQFNLMLMRTKFDFYHFMAKQSIVAPQQGLRAIDFRMPTPASNRLRMTEM